MSRLLWRWLDCKTTCRAFWRGCTLWRLSLLARSDQSHSLPSEKELHEKSDGAKSRIFVIEDNRHQTDPADCAPVQILKILVIRIIPYVAMF